MTMTPLPRGGYTCAECYPLLFPYLDGALSTQERETIAAHLRLCDSCSAWVSALKTIQATVQAEGAIIAPPGFWARFQARAQEELPLESLPGTFPEFESDAERIKRLSKFSTRRISTRADQPEDSAGLSREEKRDLQQLFPWPIADTPLPAETIIAGEMSPAVAVAPQLVARAESAKVVRTRVQYVYAAGIAAMLLIALLIGQMASRWGTPERGDPGIVAEKPYVEALLAVNFNTYRKLENPTAQGVEQFVALNATFSPIIFPAIDPSEGEYTAADVWYVKGKVVACAVAKLDGHTAAIMSSPWSAEEAIPGVERCRTVAVEDYEFLTTATADRHLMMWKQQWGESMVLYSLLVTGEISDQALQDMALSTLLEIEQRSREQSGKLPG